MDVGAITQIVGSMGFPIAMCIMMAFYIKGEQDTTREALNNLRAAIQSLTEEIKDLERARKEDGAL